MHEGIHISQDISKASSHDASYGGWGALDDLPGHPMMWILIISELLVFGGLFLGFAGTHAFDPIGYGASQSQLDRFAGGLNTLVLVSSGFLAAMAVRVRAEGRIAASRLWLTGAGALGGVFLAVKLVEYADKAAHGLNIDTNTFFTLFYLSTGFHFLHVILGLIILAIVGWKNSLENLETGVAFWHMVDLIWVLLYPIAYLIR